MQIEIDENKILAEILERNDRVHAKIIEEVERNLINKLVDEIEKKYISKSWSGSEDVARYILEDLQEKQTELVKKILKEFYDSYRYKKSDIQILKKLQEFINEN